MVGELCEVDDESPIVAKCKLYVSRHKGGKKKFGYELVKLMLRFCHTYEKKHAKKVSEADRLYEMAMVSVFFLTGIPLLEVQTMLFHKYQQVFDNSDSETNMSGRVVIGNLSAASLSKGSTQQDVNAIYSKEKKELEETSEACFKEQLQLSVKKNTLANIMRTTSSLPLQSLPREIFYPANQLACKTVIRSGGALTWFDFQESVKLAHREQGSQDKSQGNSSILRATIVMYFVSLLISAIESVSVDKGTGVLDVSKVGHISKYALAKLVCEKFMEQIPDGPPSEDYKALLITVVQLSLIADGNKNIGFFWSLYTNEKVELFGFKYVALDEGADEDGKEAFAGFLSRPNLDFLQGRLALAYLKKTKKDYLEDTAAYFEPSKKQLFLRCQLCVAPPSTWNSKVPRLSADIQDKSLSFANAALSRAQLSLQNAGVSSQLWLAGAAPETTGAAGVSKSSIFNVVGRRVSENEVHQIDVPLQVDLVYKPGETDTCTAHLQPFLSVEAASPFQAANQPQKNRNLKLVGVKDVGIPKPVYSVVDSSLVGFYQKLLAFIEDPNQNKTNNICRSLFWGASPAEQNVDMLQTWVKQKLQGKKTPGEHCLSTNNLLGLREQNIAFHNSATAFMLRALDELNNTVGALSLEKDADISSIPDATFRHSEEVLLVFILWLVLKYTNSSGKDNQKFAEIFKYVPQINTQPSSEDAFLERRGQIFQLLCKAVCFGEFDILYLQPVVYKSELEIEYFEVQVLTSEWQISSSDFSVLYAIFANHDEPHEYSAGVSPVESYLLWAFLKQNFVFENDDDANTQIYARLLKPETDAADEIGKIGFYTDKDSLDTADICVFIRVWHVKSTEETVYVDGFRLYICTFKPSTRAAHFSVYDVVATDEISQWNTDATGQAANQWSLQDAFKHHNNNSRVYFVNVRQNLRYGKIFTVSLNSPADTETPGFLYNELCPWGCVNLPRVSDGDERDTSTCEWAVLNLSDVFDLLKRHDIRSGVFLNTISSWADTYFCPQKDWQLVLPIAFTDAVNALHKLQTQIVQKKNAPEFASVNLQNSDSSLFDTTGVYHLFYTFLSYLTAENRKTHMIVAQRDFEDNKEVADLSAFTSGNSAIKACLHAVRELDGDQFETTAGHSAAQVDIMLPAVLLACLNPSYVGKRASSSADILEMLKIARLELGCFIDIDESILSRNSSFARTKQVALFSKAKSLFAEISLSTSFGTLFAHVESVAKTLTDTEYRADSLLFRLCKTDKNSCLKLTQRLRQVSSVLKALVESSTAARIVLEKTDVDKRKSFLQCVSALGSAVVADINSPGPSRNSLLTAADIYDLCNVDISTCFDDRNGFPMTLYLSVCDVKPSTLAAVGFHRDRYCNPILLPKFANAVVNSTNYLAMRVSHGLTENQEFMLRQFFTSTNTALKSIKAKFQNEAMVKCTTALLQLTDHCNQNATRVSIQKWKLPHAEFALWTSKPANVKELQIQLDLQYGSNPFLTYSSRLAAFFEALDDDGELKEHLTVRKKVSTEFTAHLQQYNVRLLAFLHDTKQLVSSICASVYGLDSHPFKFAKSAGLLDESLYEYVQNCWSWENKEKKYVCDKFHVMPCDASGLVMPQVLRAYQITVQHHSEYALHKLALDCVEARLEKMKDRQQPTDELDLLNAYRSCQTRLAAIRIAAGTVPTGSSDSNYAKICTDFEIAVLAAKMSDSGVSPVIIFKDVDMEFKVVPGFELLLVPGGQLDTAFGATKLDTIFDREKYLRQLAALQAEEDALISKSGYSGNQFRLFENRRAQLHATMQHSLNYDRISYNRNFSWFRVIEDLPQHVAGSISSSVVNTKKPTVQKHNLLFTESLTKMDEVLISALKPFNPQHYKDKTLPSTTKEKSGQLLFGTKTYVSEDESELFDARVTCALDDYSVASTHLLFLRDKAAHTFPDSTAFNEIGADLQCAEVFYTVLDLKQIQVLHSTLFIDQSNHLKFVQQTLCENLNLDLNKPESVVHTYIEGESKNSEEALKYFKRATANFFGQLVSFAKKHDLLSFDVRPESSTEIGHYITDVMLVLVAYCVYENPPSNGRAPAETVSSEQQLQLRITTLCEVCLQNIKFGTYNFYGVDCTRNLPTDEQFVSMHGTAIKVAAQRIESVLTTYNVNDDLHTEYQQEKVKALRLDAVELFLCKELMFLFIRSAESVVNLAFGNTERLSSFPS